MQNQIANNITNQMANHVSNHMQNNIQNYEDFIKALLAAGFSMGGANSEGIYSIITWDWQEEAPYETPVRWHTGDLETDPWEWRMRVLDERNDIAYGKLFFKKSGYITKEWYPYFLAARRGGKSFEEEYQAGNISFLAKKIYELICEYGSLPVHGLKALAGITKEDKAKFDKALVELQGKLYLTMCGRQQKLSQKGEEYGWSSTVFCRTENFFGQEVFEKAEQMTSKEAAEAITAQILRLNPDADPKKIRKFIKN